MESKTFTSNVDARIRAISNDLDLSEAPPIHQKRLVTFFNHFIVTMVDFLNNFSNSCSHRLFMFDRKIGKIEAELRLLEIKLNSIPGFKEDVPKPVVPTDTNTSSASEELLEANDEPATKTQEEHEEAPPEVDPVLARFIRMAQKGVPVPAVKLQMKVEGIDPELLKM
uniref:WASH complex subunit CCDC53 n=1 Tax=Lygus hesperus TaxID=30085 RepID=A0A0A9ZG80_LYGHE